MRKRSSLSGPRSVLSAAVLGIVLCVTVSASADPILRIVTFTVADPGKQEQVFQVINDVNKVFSAAKGFQWLKASYDPATGQNAGVSLWDSQAAMEVVTQSDAFKALLGGKGEVLIEGGLCSQNLPSLRTEEIGSRYSGTRLLWPS